jgi:hypothetical protein
VSRVPLVSSESRKNASGLEAYGTEAPQTPVVESPAASAADVTSTTARFGTTVTPEVDKAGTSVPPATDGEGGDCGTSGPQEEPPSRGIIAECMEAVDDEDRCLYAGTPWEAEIVTNHRDLEKFKEAVHTMGTVLLVRILAEVHLILVSVT